IAITRLSEVVFSDCRIRTGVHVRRKQHSLQLDTFRQSLMHNVADKPTTRLQSANFRIKQFQRT
ncbi:hypothetical protein, partial [Fluviicola sp.]|uniref:hypothetical protein n=1 Tax=Fluviicola sp. TaxID=1917219 RepID=UPI00262E1E46